MQTVTSVKTRTQECGFGYWDMEQEEWIELDGVMQKPLDIAVEKLKCSEELLQAIASSFKLLVDAMCVDLADIWLKVA